MPGSSSGRACSAHRCGQNCRKSLSPPSSLTSNSPYIATSWQSLTRHLPRVRWQNSGAGECKESPRNQGLRVMFFGELCLFVFGFPAMLPAVQTVGLPRRINSPVALRRARLEAALLLKGNLAHKFWVQGIAVHQLVGTWILENPRSRRGCSRRASIGHVACTGSAIDRVLCIAQSSPLFMTNFGGRGLRRHPPTANTRSRRRRRRRAALVVFFFCPCFHLRHLPLFMA